MFSSPPTREDVLAAIDIGTNNCRLLIARPTPVLQADGSLRLQPEIIDAFSRLVRLGEGISTSPVLTETAITRTLEALALCTSKMHRRGVTRYRAVTTEACRRASNTADFLHRVEQQTGLQLEVISSEEEARLALQGCAPLFEPNHEFGLHFDIGGGSTELVWARLTPHADLHMQADIVAQVSIPCGVTALTETYGGDLVAPETYEAMVAEIKSHLAPFAAKFADDFAYANRNPNGSTVQFLGCAGTISTIAALVQELPFYQRLRVDGYHLDMGDARRVFDMLLKLDFKGRAAIPSLGNERADLILAGCAIVEAIADTWNAATIRVADRGVREGILYDLAGVHRLGQ